MFLLDKVEQVRWVRPPDKIERPYLEARSQAVDNVDGFLASQGLFQKLPGIVYAAHGDELVGHHQFLEFGKDRVFLIRLYSFKPRYLEGKGFYLVLAQELEYFRGNIRSDTNQKYGGFLASGKFLDSFFFAAARSRGICLSLPIPPSARF
jgi:hypothetical protein